MIIDDEEKLEEWLEEHYWFEHGFLSNIEDDEKDLTLTVGYPTKDTLIAGEPKTLLEFRFKPKNIKEWIPPNKDFEPDYDICYHEFELTEEGLGLTTEWPQLFKLTFESIEISEPKRIETFTKPWVSRTDISFSLPEDKLPVPKFWINAFELHSIEVGFRMMADKIKNPEDIPFPDYSGYFLQRTDRIQTHDEGTFVFNVSLRDGNAYISFELNDEELSATWSILEEIISGIEGVEVESGNVTFNQVEWKEYLYCGRLPGDLDKIEYL